MIFDGILRRRSLGYVICVALLMAALRSWPGPAMGAIANADAEGAEKAALAEILSPGEAGAVASVARVRAQSALSSTLPASELDKHLAGLLRWMVHDYAGSGPLRLLAALPEGTNAVGRSDAHLLALQKTYWLQDNSLYGAAALGEYVPVLGRFLADSWRGEWQKSFPKFCPDTQSDYVIGHLPGYDQRGLPEDPRCRLPRPGAWQFFREYQYPNPAAADFDGLRRPIIGTDYPADAQLQSRMAPIRPNNARNLLKYGCLRQVLAGNDALAGQMFALALADWDGNGFVGPRNDPRNDARLSGSYWTRDLAFALLCANALGQGRQPAWGNGREVAKAAIEQRLWSAQSPTGGIWTNYCVDAREGDRLCLPGQKIPVFAKQTNELAPLVLLAYGPDIWLSPH